jgi:hypothetical protein
VLAIALQMLLLAAADGDEAGVALALVSMPSAACAGAGVALRIATRIFRAGRIGALTALVWAVATGGLVAWGIWMVSA